MPDLEHERRRGEEAKRILESDLYRDTIEQIRGEFVQALIDVPVRDSEGLMTVKLMLKVLDKVNSTIHDTMTTGKMAKIQLERMELIDERKR